MKIEKKETEEVELLVWLSVNKDYTRRKITTSFWFIDNDFTISFVHSYH